MSFSKNDITATTHNGVRTEFFRNYIKTGVIDKKLNPSDLQTIKSVY